MEMGKGTLVNKGSLCQAETLGHRVDSHLYALPRFRHHTLPIIFVAISGPGSLQGTGPLSKFFQAVRWKVKFLSESFGLDCFQLE